MANELSNVVRSTNGLYGGARTSGDAETVQSVDRALAIVELLLRSRAPLTVREVAAGTGINRTTAHRLLTSLHRRGWIERIAEPAGTVPVCAIWLWCVTCGTGFCRRGQTNDGEVSLLSRETVHLGILDNHDVLHIEKVDSPEAIGLSSRVGTRAAPHVTGLGKALLASGSDEELETYIENARSVPCPHQSLTRRHFAPKSR